MGGPKGRSRSKNDQNLKRGWDGRNGGVWYDNKSHLGVTHQVIPR